MWNVLEGLSRIKCHKGGNAGLEGDESRRAALAFPSTQLISTGCWRLAGRRETVGGNGWRPGVRKAAAEALPLKHLTSIPTPLLALTCSQLECLKNNYFQKSNFRGFFSN